MEETKVKDLQRKAELYKDLLVCMNEDNMVVKEIIEAIENCSYVNIMGVVEAQSVKPYNELLRFEINGDKRYAEWKEGRGYGLEYLGNDDGYLLFPTEENNKYLVIFFEY